MHPKRFSFRRIRAISFINKSDWHIFQKTIMSLTFKLTIKIFLHEFFILIKLTILRFVVIPPRSKAVCSLTIILFITYLTCGKVHGTFNTSVKFSPVTVLENVSVQKSRHTLYNVSYHIYKILLSFRVGTIQLLQYNI